MLDLGEVLRVGARLLFAAALILSVHQFTGRAMTAAPAPERKTEEPPHIILRSAHPVEQYLATTEGMIEDSERLKVLVHWDQDREPLPVFDLIGAPLDKEVDELQRALRRTPIPEPCMGYAKELAELLAQARQLSGRCLVPNATQISVLQTLDAEARALTRRYQLMMQHGIKLRASLPAR